MTDMLKTIIPKSDQLNFDDLPNGVTKTVKITKVSIGAHEQPVAINYEGDGGKPYKPCKSMCRVLVGLWGADAKAYVGRSMTLYGDPKVKFGGLEVGGIRISHMSHIKEPVTMALTATKASRKPFTVRVLESQNDAVPDKSVEMVKANLENSAKRGTVALQETWENLDPTYQRRFESVKDGLKETAKEADGQKHQ